MQAIIKRATPRPIRFTPHVNPYAHGSVLVEYGKTQVYVTVMVENSVPPFLKGKNQGWLTAEYSMLPAAGQTRIARDRKGVSGRSQEIQRLIGRSLRSVVDLQALGERTINIDCDVLVADGSTRTASITGACVAARFAFEKLIQDREILIYPMKEMIASVSVGISHHQEILIDLDYSEDSHCTTDMNIVMTETGKFVEIQGTAETRPFDQETLQLMLSTSKEAIAGIIQKQKSLWDHL